MPEVRHVGKMPARSGSGSERTRGGHHSECGGKQLVEVLAESNYNPPLVPLRQGNDDPTLCILLVIQRTKIRRVVWRLRGKQQRRVDQVKGWIGKWEVVRT